MKMRIFLIQLSRNFYSKLDIYNTSEPLGLLSIDSYLKSYGFNVNYSLISGYSNKNYENVLEEIIKFSPKIVAFSSMTCQFYDSVALAKLIKKELPNVLIVIGGDHISTYPNDIINYPEFDIAIAGEGEFAMKWVVDNIKKDFNKLNVPQGIFWKKNGKLYGFGRTERIEEIDKLPFPTRDKNLLKKSHVGAIMWPPAAQQTGMASIYASRGCPYACNYCDSKQIWGGKVKWRSTSKIIEELNILYNKYSVNTAFFVDLTFNSNRSKVFELCEGLKKNNPGISWYVLLRPETTGHPCAVDKSMLIALKEAGCIKVGFGIETISKKTKKQLNRTDNSENLYNILRWSDEIGLLTKVFIMIGHPDEDNQYYEILYKYLLKLCADEIRISFITPFPGSILWEKYKTKILEASDYSTFTTFSPKLKHPLFDFNELTNIRVNLLNNYYKSNEYKNHIFEKQCIHPQFSLPYKEFLEYISTELNNAFEKKTIKESAIQLN